MILDINGLNAKILPNCFMFKEQ